MYVVCVQCQEYYDCAIMIIAYMKNNENAYFT